MRTTIVLLALVACDGGRKTNGPGAIDAPSSIDATVPTDTPPGFACADDSVLEGTGRNNTIQTAYVTPVAATRNMLTIAGLAICPVNDVDIYAVTVQAEGGTFVADVEYEPSTAETTNLSVSILNGGGAAISNGTPTTGTHVVASAASLPVGTYYARVSGAGRNNYKLALSVN